MTKAELIAENERLQRELAKAVAANQLALDRLKAATGAAFYGISWDKQGVPVPLTREQKAAIRDDIEDLVSRQLPSTQEMQTVVFEPLNLLLPNFTHYAVRYSYSQHDGVYVEDFWGLAEVK